MDEKIRILFFIGSMGGGGSERQVLGILRHIDRSRFTPLLYLINKEGEFLEDVPEDVPVHAFWERQKQPSINYPGKIHRMQVSDLVDLLKSESIDLLYARTFHATLVAHGAAESAGIPWVAVEVVDPSLGIERYAGKFVAVKRRLLKKAYRAATRVLTVSEGVRLGIIETYGVPEDQVTAMHNFLDLDRIRNLSVENQPEFEEGRFHVVCAGRLHEQKGYLYLLEAAKILVEKGHASMQVHILGQGELQQELAQFVDENNLREKVTFHGFVQNPYPFIAAADLFCLSSLYEGMPNSLLEAMACGTPVLSTDCPSGPKEILEDGRWGRLISPADSSALAEGLEEAMANTNEWKARAEVAMQHVHEEYSPRNGIARLEDLLLSL